MKTFVRLNFILTVKYYTITLITNTTKSAEHSKMVDRIKYFMRMRLELLWSCTAITISSSINVKM